MKIEENPRDFSRNLTYLGDYNKYDNYPVLSYINPKDFINIFNNLNFEDQRFLVYCIETRYGIENKKDKVTIDL